MPRVACPKCNRANPTDAKFCNGCGNKIPKLENFTEDAIEKVAEFSQKYQSIMSDWLEPRFRTFSFAPRPVAPFDLGDAMRFWAFLAPIYKDRVFSLNQFQAEDTPRKMVDLFNEMINDLFTDKIKVAHADVVNRFKLSQGETEKLVDRAKDILDEAKAILEEMVEVEKEIKETLFQMPKDYVEQTFAGFKDFTAQLLQGQWLNINDIGASFQLQQERLKELTLKFAALWQRYVDTQNQSSSKLFELHKQLLHDTLETKFNEMIDMAKNKNLQLLDLARLDTVMDQYQDKLNKYQKEIEKMATSFFDGRRWM